MTNTISNMDDLIDVRDIIARIEELETELECETDATIAMLTRIELRQLTDLMADMKVLGGDEQWRGDWYHLTMIRDSHFVNAMQELCEDIGDFPNGVPSYYVIDWEATARNLQQDYTSVEFDGVTYWVR